MLNYDQMTGIIRAIVPPVVAYLVGKGYLPEQAATDILAACLAIAAAAWSVVNNQTGKVIK